MLRPRIFTDRRRRNRRQDPDPCQQMPLDLYHRKRRKSAERRHTRTLLEDYHAFIEAYGARTDKADRSAKH